MSMKTYVEAIEYVLDTELDARSELICFRPGAKSAFSEAERDMPLPRIGKKAFSVALGAALYGMRPVLDLRQETGAAQLLREALDDLPAGMRPVMTVILCAEDRETIMELQGVYVLEPKTPRQAAGFMRSALKMPRMTILLADQTLFAEEDDIPEDRSFAMLPLEQTEEEAKAEEKEEAAFEEPVCEQEACEAAEEGTAEAVEAEAMDERAAYDEAEAEPVQVFTTELEEEAAYREAEAEPVYIIETDISPEELAAGQAEEVHLSAEEPEEKRSSVFCATRMTRCDLSALRSLCALLEMEEEALVRRCAGHVLPVGGGFELYCETDAPEGETAFLPPQEENAALWLGSDALTVSYDPAQMEHAEAARLLRAVKRVLEKPQLLIYDKEYDRK